MRGFIIFIASYMILVVKRGRMSWVGHVACVEEKRYVDR